MTPDNVLASWSPCCDRSFSGSRCTWLVMPNHASITTIEATAQARRLPSSLPASPRINTVRPSPLIPADHTFSHPADDQPAARVITRRPAAHPPACWHARSAMGAVKASHRRLRKAILTHRSHRRGRPNDVVVLSHGPAHSRHERRADPAGDRKSTRLNSSHVAISYAVFCLKKKKN